MSYKANVYGFLLAVCTICVLVGCSPQKRLTRLVERHPELVQKDTVWIADTIVTIRAENDTVIVNSITRDTIIIKDRQLTIRYYNTGDSIYIKGECDTIKIIREIPVEVHTVSPVKYEKYTPGFMKFSAWAFWILLILAILVGYWYFKYYRNRSGN